jgi:hypothetical protein
MRSKQEHWLAKFREIGVSVHFLSYFLKPIHGKLIADGI